MSGGCDSMSLCLLFQHISDKIIAFTVDHQLRPESRKEAEKVHEHVLKMGFQHEILTIVWSGDKSPKKSIEKIAREQRYALLTRACLYHDIRVLFLAHHLNDQVETVLMRLIEKSGSYGLAGIQKISPNPMIGSIMNAERILLCRPFLDISKIFLKSI